MTHGSKIVNFGGLDLRDDGDEVRCIAQVTVVEEQFDSGLVSVLVDVIDTTRVETRRTTNETMDL